MVVRDELGRYLAETASWLAEITNGQVAVFDDGSSDGTVNYLRQVGFHVDERPEDVPAFSEDESECRGAAWRYMEAAFAPRAGDWVLSVDADEFLVCPENTSVEATREALQACIREAMGRAETTVTFRVAEVFGWAADGQPLIRTDGYWDSIRATRLGAWKPGGRFGRCKDGGGSLPASLPKARTLASLLEILHLGYARQTDRQMKQERYSRRGGHNPSHIGSIQAPPALRRWHGQLPAGLVLK